jgi:hypothetical protein
MSQLTIGWQCRVEADAQEESEEPAECLIALGNGMRLEVTIVQTRLGVL